MDIRVMSDLHIEFFDFEPTEVPADVVVLAGDILTEHYGLQWARSRFPDKPIVYVMGNHEYYDAHYERVLERARKEAADLGIHLLENDQAVIDGVRFLGATLWTDFEVEEPLLPRSLAYRYANGSMTDFSIIRYRGGMLSAEATREFHSASRQWLTDRLAEPFDGKTVVVTHHLPHKFSIDRQFHQHPLNPAFASHMPEFVRPPVDLWIHGFMVQGNCYPMRNALLRRARPWVILSAISGRSVLFGRGREGLGSQLWAQQLPGAGSN